MLSKCEWKNGKFEGCTNYCAVFGAYIEYTSGRRHNFCSFCGADIRKPEEKPLIVKSGETWVTNNKDYNFLWKGENLDDEFQPRAILRLKFINKDPLWVSFDEIEEEGLTDEIAKLRPMVFGWNMVKDPDECFYKLLGVGTLKYRYVGEQFQLECVRLATPHELLEIE